MKLLLVDDDALVLESLEILLSEGPSIVIAGKAEQGAQALSFLQNHPVDMVLLDIQMPVMDGIETLQRIRAEFPRVKILMLTTFADYRTLHRCLESGLPVISEQALRSFSEDQLFSDLKEREQEVLMQLAQGLSNKEIAIRLCMSEGTVRNMISVMLDKLDLRDRTQLAIAYWQRKSRGR